jgi:hypothetical protein
MYGGLMILQRSEVVDRRTGQILVTPVVDPIGDGCAH